MSHLTLLKLYSGHCERLLPELEAASKIVKENDPPVLIAEVIGSDYPDLVDKFNVNGFPTMFFFK
jgi:protein disulfide-isomerase A1